MSSSRCLPSYIFAASPVSCDFSSASFGINIQPIAIEIGYSHASGNAIGAISALKIPPIMPPMEIHK